jgi:hypothetical protein
LEINGQYGRKKGATAIVGHDTVSAQLKHAGLKCFLGAIAEQAGMAK